jgi:hypothetical protein
VNLSAPGPKPGFQSCGRAGDCDVVFSYAMFRDLQKIQTVVTDIAAHVGFSANLAYEAQTSSGEGLLVSGSYFPVLELQPALDDCSIRMTTNSSASRALWCSATTIGCRDLGSIQRFSTNR